jgi:hypothetical protein
LTGSFDAVKNPPQVQTKAPKTKKYAGEVLRAVILTHPDGFEQEFPSATACSEFLNVSRKSLLQWMAGEISWPGSNPQVRGEMVWNFRARFKDGNPEGENLPDI